MPHAADDYHAYDEHVPVEVEHDGTWWPGWLYARGRINGEWWGWVDRHVGDLHTTSAVPYTRIRERPIDGPPTPDHSS